MPYSYRDIVALIPTTAYTTIVFDFLENNKSRALKHQLELMFHSNAYCYVKRERDDMINNELCLEIERTLNARLVREHTLLNTQYHFNFVFYVEVEDLNDVRLDAIMSVIKGLKRMLAAPTLQVYSFLCVCKDRQNTVNAMENFDHCAHALLESTDVESPRLVLIDGLPLSEVDPWLRASVRAMNALSCDNPFATALRSKSKTIWNWSMTEFDVQAKETEDLKRDQLKAFWHGTGEFPRGILERNFNNLIADIFESYEKSLKFSAENIPIPSNVIGGLFRRRALQANIPPFTKAVERTIYENVAKPILEGIRTMDHDMLCDKLLLDIPLDDWKKVGKELDSIQVDNKVESLEDMPKIKINLDVQPKVEDMRVEINGGLNSCVNKIKAFVTGYLALILQSCLNQYIESHLQAKIGEVSEELRKLETANIVAVDAQDYLRRLEELNGNMMSVSHTIIYDKSVYVLISDDTYNLWQQLYEQELNLQGCQVYNYHSLEEFEFQTLILTTWRLEEYDKNRQYFFRVQ